MTFPEVLTIGAAVANIGLSLTAIPIDFTGLEIIASPTAIPIHPQEAAAFYFFNKKGHGNEIFLNFRALHQLIKFFDLLIGPINVHDEDFFSVYRKVFFAHRLNFHFKCRMIEITHHIPIGYLRDSA